MITPLLRLCTVLVLWAIVAALAPGLARAQATLPPTPSAPWAPRSAGLTLVGQLGGLARSVAIEPSGRSAYVGIGPRVWRVALDAERPRLAEASPILAGVVTRLAIQDGLLLAAAGAGGLVVFDLDRAGEGWSHPVGSLTRDGRVVVSFSVQGREALVIDRPTNSPSSLGDRALRVDLGDPSAPRAGQSLRWPSLIEGALFGDVWLLVSQAGLRTHAFRLDADGARQSLAVAPALVGDSIGVRILSGRPWILTTAGLARVEVAADAQGGDDFLRIGDWAFTDQPPFDVVADGAGAWLLDQGNGLWHMSLDPPHEPRMMRGGGSGPMAFAAGWLAFAQGSSLRLYRGRSPDPEADLDLHFVAIPPPHLSFRSALHGRCALAGDWFQTRTPSSWVDLSQLEAPRAIGDLPLTRPWAIAPGSDVFLVSSSVASQDDSGELHAVRCGDEMLGPPLALPAPAAAIARSGRHALVALGYQLGVYDLGTPLSPRLLGTWPRQPFDTAVSGLTTSADRWAATLPGQVLVGRYDPPSLPRLDATLPVPVAPSAQLLVGHTLLVAAPRTLSAIDLSDPAAPRLTDEIDLPGTPRTLALAKPGHAWVVVDDRPAAATLRLIDLRGGALRERAWTALPGVGWHVSAAGRTAVVAGGEAGLVVVRDPTPPEGPTIHLPLLRGAPGP